MITSQFHPIRVLVSVGIFRLLCAGTGNWRRLRTTMSIIIVLSFYFLSILVLLHAWTSVVGQRNYSMIVKNVTGLSVPLRGVHPPKCIREIPAILSQMEKDEPIVGNGSSIFFNVIEECCRGYKRYEYDWSKCVPDCELHCHQNAFCGGGRRCICFDGFVNNELGECVPTCPLGCPNGQCFLNGTCVCNRGFRLDPTKKYCIPHCELACGHNEICIAPDTCVCAEGFTKAYPSSPYGCQPVCIPDCGFGRCVGPNQCECFQNYKKKINGTVCQANCYMRCDNGFCTSQTNCACQDGYKYDYNTTSCLPDCGETCENGICIAPGVCRCFNGYIRNGSYCDPICENGCGFYGHCIAPNVCGCSIVRGRNSTYQSCRNGNCNAFGHCRCNEGTTRFINECLTPENINTYAAGSKSQKNLNEALVMEFNLLVGNYFMIRVPKN